MNWRNYFVLYLVGIGMIWLVAQFQTAPGYMDADYYLAGGMQLAEGKGFTEPFIWNYLNDPKTLPVASHAYWMPLASIVAATGLKLFGSGGFFSARISFILAAGLIAPMTARLAFALTRRTWNAWMAGLLATLPGFYLAYLGTTDTFALFAVLGAAWFITANLAMSFDAYTTGSSSHDLAWALLLGVIAGLMHLTRADGVLWLGMSLLAVIWVLGRNSPGISKPRIILNGLLCLAGYALVMGPWFLRNLTVFGAPLAPGASKALWLLSYDELYQFPANTLTPARWWSAGVGSLLSERWAALWQNVQSTLVVQGQIFLAPLILAGWWRYRRHDILKLALVAWLIIFFVMTFVFPLAGWRGGYFHSGIALQPVLWAVVPAGLEAFVEWGKRVRRWNTDQALTVFRVGLLCLALLLSLLTAYRRVIGKDIKNPEWGSNALYYQRLEEFLQSTGAKRGTVILVNNPPGYYVANRRPAIAVPNGDETVARLAALEYGARYLLVEPNHPASLREFYNRPGEHPGWKYLGELEGTYLYEIR